jgi:hypothetical protein
MLNAGGWKQTDSASRQQIKTSAPESDREASRVETNDLDVKSVQSKPADRISWVGKSERC